MPYFLFDHCTVYLDGWAKIIDKCFWTIEDTIISFKNILTFTENDDGEGEVTSTIFSDVDLTDKEWADYDEKSDESTCISEFEIKFVTVKEK